MGLRTPRPSGPPAPWAASGFPIAACSRSFPGSVHTSACRRPLSLSAARSNGTRRRTAATHERRLDEVRHREQRRAPRRREQREAAEVERVHVERRAQRRERQPRHRRGPARRGHPAAPRDPRPDVQLVVAPVPASDPRSASALVASRRGGRGGRRSGADVRDDVLLPLLHAEKAVRVRPPCGERAQGARGRRDDGARRVARVDPLVVVRYPDDTDRGAVAPEEVLRRRRWRRGHRGRRSKPS